MPMQCLQMSPVLSRSIGSSLVRCLLKFLDGKSQAKIVMAGCHKVAAYAMVL